MNAEKNKIIKSGFSSVLQIIAASLSYAIIYLFIILKLGKEQLGIWAVITSIPAVVSFLGSGVSGSLIRYIPIYVVKKQEQFAIKIIFNGFVFNFGIGLLISITAFFFATPLLKFMFGINEVPALYLQLFYCALITFFINFLSSVFLASLDGLQKIVKKNKILIVSSLLFCIAGVFMIFNFKLKGLLYAQLFQALLVFFLSLIAIYRTSTFNFKYRNFDIKFLRLFYTYGGSLQYISILNILFEPITKFFLNRYFGLGVVGVYDLVNRIVSQLRMVIVNAIQVIVPFVAKEIEENNIAVQHIYQKSFKGALLLSVILFGLLISAGYSFIYVFEKIKIVEFQVILLYLTIANVINILSAPAYAIRLATGKLKYLITAQLISTGLNIMLFMCLGLNPYHEIMLLPTSLAIGLSSIYIIVNYQYTLKLKIQLSSNDIYIAITSLSCPIICIVIASFWFNLTLLLGVATIHIAIVLLLAFKNDYLMQVIHILVGKKNKDN